MGNICRSLCTYMLVSLYIYVGLFVHICCRHVMGHIVSFDKLFDCCTLQRDAEAQKEESKGGGDTRSKMEEERVRSEAEKAIRNTREDAERKAKTDVDMTSGHLNLTNSSSHGNLMKSMGHDSATNSTPPVTHTPTHTHTRVSASEGSDTFPELTSGHLNLTNSISHGGFTNSMGHDSFTNSPIANDYGSVNHEELLNFLSFPVTPVATHTPTHAHTHVSATEGPDSFFELFGPPILHAASGAYICSLNTQYLVYCIKTCMHMYFHRASNHPHIRPPTLTPCLS